MKIRWAMAVVLVWLLPGPPGYRAQETRSLEGVVLESETNRPLEGVKISASMAGVQVSGTTDARGRFKITASKPGRYSVVPSLKGYIYSRPAHVKTGREAGVWVQIADGRPVPPFELRMVKPGAVVGKVLTATGETMPGNVATVTLLQYTYDASGQRTLNSVPGLHFAYEGSFVRMDDRGEYRFYDVPPGDYYLRVYGGGVVGAGTMYYPGTPDEARAQTVQVKPGEELRLNTITLPPKKGTEVRLHFPNPAEYKVFSQMTIVQSGAQGIYISGSRRSVDGEDEITLPFAPGHYDLFVGSAPLSASPGRPAPDALFGTISLDVGDSPIDRQVVVSRGLKINGAATLVNEAGVRSPVALFPPGGGLTCRFISDVDPSRSIGGSTCIGWSPAGNYRLELGELPTDQYVQSVTIGDRDVLAQGIQLQGDVNLQIVLATPGAILEGVVKDAAGEKLADAVVVLVPDAPYRSNGGPLYRSTISDVSGNFELRGIAPGNYHVFAWPDLEGPAYRNAEFLKKYEDAGKAIRIEKGTRSVTDVTASTSP
jgi:hypothetical protein